MEVTRIFEYKNVASEFANIKSHPLYKNTSLIKDSSDLVKRLSSMNMAATPSTKNAKTHYQTNPKTEHYQRNALNNIRPRPTTRCNLPKSATNILKDWLLRNWHDPYPTEKEKGALAHATGLRLEQVNNWLINGRRRLLPGLCHKYGLDHSKAKIAKRGGNRGLVLENLQRPAEEVQLGSCGASRSPNLDRFSLSFPGSGVVSSPDVTYNIVLQVPDSPEHPIMLDYLADVMLVNEELEKQPNKEGLSRQELLCRRGLGERLYPCSS